MIHSDKQRRITAEELGKLKKALTAIAARQSDPAWLHKAEMDAIRSEIERMEADIAEYDMLKAGEITFAKSFALEGLPLILVQARIAAGMSQTSLAKALNMKPQQVQRYEASEYQGASLARLIEVSRVLRVNTEGLFGNDQEAGGGVFSWQKADDVEWRRLPISEMVKRGWFDVAPGTDAVNAAKDYFQRAIGTHLGTAFHRMKVRGGPSPNEYALLAWQARVLERARRRIESGGLSEFTLDDRWVGELVALTRRADGPRQAVDLLARNGIVMLTVERLNGSSLDGAAMLSESGHPVIGLTLRFDRLDNFWFVLFHELGHVFLHASAGSRYDFFDEDDTAVGDRLEREADEFALNWLIPSDEWNGCGSRTAITEEAVLRDAETLGTDASIIAGRIRRERNDYTVLNGLIGQGRVRCQFD